MKQPKVKKVKIYTYHTSHSFVEKDKKMDMLTQLYKVGVYAIVNSDPALQLNLTPKDMVSIERRLNKGVILNEISDLKFGRAISVYENEEGFWTEKID
jgi:hypothetical protein